MEYRKAFYEDYHSTQSGRRSHRDIEAQILEEKRRFRVEVLKLLKNVDKNDWILDLGCGNGSLLQMLHDDGYEKLTGIDISKEQVVIAKSRTNLDIRCSDAETFLKSVEVSYQCIMAMDVIEHLDKNELLQLIQLLYQKLNPGGIAIFRTPNMDGLHSNSYAYGDYTHECLLNPSSAKQLGLVAGFRVVEIYESNMATSNFLKEIMRKILFAFIKFRLKLEWFATGKSIREMVVSPNMLIVMKKQEAV